MRKEVPDFQGDLNRLTSSEINNNGELLVVSAKMLRRLVDLKLADNQDTDIKGGLTPWHTIYVSKSHQADLQRYAAIYNLMMGGDTVSYVEVDKFDEIDSHVILPIKFSQFKRSQ